MERDSFRGDLTSVGNVGLDVKWTANVETFSTEVLLIEPSWFRSGGKEDSAKLVEILLAKDQKDRLQFGRRKRLRTVRCTETSFAVQELRC